MFVLGGVDSGKTTFARRLARAGLDAGHVVAIVDADLGQSTIGPPGTVGLKVVRERRDLSSTRRYDALAFVGAMSPRNHFLSLVTGTAKLVMRAIEMGARLIVVDTSGLIDGVAGQTLKLTKAELCRPHHVVSLAARRRARAHQRRPRAVPVPGRHAAAGAPGHRDAVRGRAGGLPRAAPGGLPRGGEGPKVYRWRVKPTVFMPSLPPIFELEELDGLLVGVDDGEGDCLGLGILEYREDALRLLTPVSEGVRALRLGSVRVTQDGKITERVDLRLDAGDGLTGRAAHEVRRPAK